MGLCDGPVAGLLNDIQRKMEGVRPAIDVFLLRTRRSAALDAEGVQYGIIFFMVEIGAVFASCTEVMPSSAQPKATFSM